MTKAYLWTKNTVSAAVNSEPPEQDYFGKFKFYCRWELQHNGVPIFYPQPHNLFD